MKLSEMKTSDMQTIEAALTKVEERQTKTGKSYCILTLKPEGEPAVEARLWDADRASVLADTPEQTAVVIQLRADEYQGQRNYVAMEMDPASEPDDLTRFADEGIDGMSRLDFLDQCVKKAVPDEAPEYRVYRALMDKYKEQWAVWPAAQSIHHAYPGGLAEHSVRVFFEMYRIIRFSQSLKKIMECPDSQTAQILQGILSDLDQTRTCVKAAAVAVSEIPKVLSSPTKSASLMRIRIQTEAVKELLHAYPYLDKDLLLSASVLRGIGTVLVPGSDTGIGGAAADILLIRPYVEKEERESEDIRLLEHILLCREPAGTHVNNVQAAVPEAFLLESAVEMADILLNELNENPEKTLTLNIPALLTGAALHDIGKLKEMQAVVCGPADYTIPGTLKGHILIGMEMVYDTAETLGIDPGDIRSLLSVIASHHGKLEWGALSEPDTPEAELLACADLLDSRMDMHRREREQMDAGTTSVRLRPYLHAVLYKPEEKTEM